MITETNIDKQENKKRDATGLEEENINIVILKRQKLDKLNEFGPVNISNQEDSQRDLRIEGDSERNLQIYSQRDSPKISLENSQREIEPQDTSNTSMGIEEDSNSNYNDQPIINENKANSKCNEPILTSSSMTEETENKMSKESTIDLESNRIKKPMSPASESIPTEPKSDKIYKAQISKIRQEEKGRGKRMFGHLLGTLGKIKKSTSSDSAISKENQRREIEAKVREKQKQAAPAFTENSRRQSKDDKWRPGDRYDSYEPKRRRKANVDTYDHDYKDDPDVIKSTRFMRENRFLYTKSEPEISFLPAYLTEIEYDILTDPKP